MPLFQQGLGWNHPKWVIGWWLECSRWLIWGHRHNSWEMVIRHWSVLSIDWHGFEVATTQLPWLAHPPWAPKQSRFFSISITKRGCEREGDITISTYFNIHFTPCILYIYYLPILVQVPLTYISHHGGFKIFQASQLIAGHWPGILPTPWIWGQSIPLQRFSLRGAPNTAQKVEEMMKLEFLNWFVRTFCAKYNWDSSGTTAIAICKKVCWSNLEYVKTPISKPIRASGMARCCHCHLNSEALREESNLKRRVPTPEPDSVSGTIPGGILWIYLPILDLFPKNARLSHNEMMIVTIAFTNLPVF